MEQCERITQELFEPIPRLGRVLHQNYFLQFGFVNGFTGYFRIYPQRRIQVHSDVLIGMAIYYV